MQKVTLIPGDGIGPEVTEATVEVLDAAGADIEWHRVEAGGSVIEQYNSPVPHFVLDSIRTTKVALKGPIATPIGKGFTSANVTIRKQLNLYAAVRRSENYPGVESRYDNVRLVIVRENTEGQYSGIEHEVVPGVVESLKIITRAASERIARFAFDLARAEGWGKVTAVHKANIMKQSDGLFLDCCRAEAERNPDIAYEEAIIDACAMQLVVDPTRFEVMVMENFYGDVLSDLAAGLVGGLGTAAGANVGDDIAVFEPVHGSAPDIAGQGVANPVATLFSAVRMLHWMGRTDVSERVRDAVFRTLESGTRTRDLGGTASTADFTKAVVDRVRG